MTSASVQSLNTNVTLEEQYDFHDFSSASILSSNAEQKESVSLPNSLNENESQSTRPSLPKFLHSESNNPDWVKMEATDIGKSVFLASPLSKDRKDLKVSSIHTAVTWGDMGLLSTLAISREGLLTNEYRAKIWPLFLGISDINSIPDFDHLDKTPHKDENQVVLDINRSFTNYPKPNTTGLELSQLRENLQTIIFKVLRKYPNLSYYQGYHDVAQVILLVFDNDIFKSFVFLEKLTIMHLRDYMMPDIGPSVNHLNLILLVIYYRDYNFFKILNNLKPYYALSSIITLFTHDIVSYHDICYVFDFLFATSHSNGSIIYNAIYLYSQIVLSNKNQILNSIFENIYSKIASEPASSSYLSENDTLADSIVSTNTYISDDSATTNENKQQQQSSDLSDVEYYGFSSISESQYKKTSSLSNSDFFGYEDSDIEFINFDHLHNILANLVNDFTNKKNDSLPLFEVFTSTAELSKTYPIHNQIESIDNSKTFQKDCKSSQNLTIKINQYSVLKTTSKFIDDTLQEPTESHVPLEAIISEQVAASLEDQRIERETQLREFDEAMKKRKLAKQQKQVSKKSNTLLSLILYPLSHNNALSRFFSTHSFFKVSIAIGVVSVILNIYFSRGNPNYFHPLLEQAQKNIFSLGHSGYIGIRSIFQSNHLMDFNWTDNLHEFNVRLFN